MAFQSTQKLGNGQPNKLALLYMSYHRGEYDRHHISLEAKFNLYPFITQTCLRCNINGAHLAFCACLKELVTCWQRRDSPDPLTNKLIPMQEQNWFTLDWKGMRTELGVYLPIFIRCRHRRGTKIKLTSPRDWMAGYFFITDRQRDRLVLETPTHLTPNYGLCDPMVTSLALGITSKWTQFNSLFIDLGELFSLSNLSLPTN